MTARNGAANAGSDRQPGPARTRIKICGLARAEDARLAAVLGADFLGLVLAESPRRIDLAEARRWVPEVRAQFPSPRWVGVFVQPAEAEVEEAVSALGLDLVQIHGLSAQESASRSAPWTGRVPWTCPVPWIRAVGEKEAAAILRTLAEPSSGPAPWAVLVDSSAGGGTGHPFDWTGLRNRMQGEAHPPLEEGLVMEPLRLILAGGLAADNVARAIETLHPYAVDASSRLEASPGRKDPEKLRAFMAAVRGGAVQGGALQGGAVRGRRVRGGIDD